MPARRDYRKLVTRNILLVFFGLLAALLAPDLGLGLGPFVSIPAVLAVAAGTLQLARLPVGGLYRPFMFAAGALAICYACVLSILLFSPAGYAPSWLSGIAKVLGATAFFLITASLEIICRRLKWLRLARGWLFTESLVGIFYAIPALFGFFERFYAAFLEKWRLFGLLVYEVSAFEFHGMRLPGVVGESRWPVLLLFVLVLPTLVTLVNLLRTYVQAASPPPPVDDSKPIPWSRR